MQDPPNADHLGVTTEGRGFWDLLREKDRQAVRKLSTTVTVPAGTVILRGGSKTNHVYVIVAGQVKIVSAGRGGHVAVLALRGAGDIIGELAAIDGSPHLADVVCVDHTTAYRIRERAFRDLLSHNPDIAHAVLMIVASRLRRAGHQRVERADRPVPARLAALLLDLAERHGTSTDGQVSLTLPVSQADLAAIITASREAVTKVLREWRRTRVVSTGRGWMILLRPDLLRDIADD